MQGGWDEGLRGLLHTGAITGYALIAHDGSVNCAYGSLTDDFWQDSPFGGAAAETAAQQFHAAFHTDFSPTNLKLCGQQAVVCQRTDTSLFAVSRCKRLGVLASYLPSGILVSTFGHPHLPQLVLPRVEAVCDLLRRP
jgi:hypothetical protein